MQVFISWSGDQSEKIAKVIAGWIPKVIQVVKTYYSPNDIRKGSRWFEDISKELEETKIGLICLTRDNLEAPWIMFEAGAISKSVVKARVCTILFGLEPTDMKGPLVQFNATKFAKEEVKKLVVSINEELKENAISSSILSDAFNAYWPELEKEINEILKQEPAHGQEPIRGDRELLEEILQMTRGLSRRASGIPVSRIPSRVITDLKQGVKCFANLAEDFAESLDPEQISDFDSLARAVDYLARMHPPGRLEIVRGNTMKGVRLSDLARQLHKPLIDDDPSDDEEAPH